MIGDTIHSALTTLFSGRVYPDVGPFDAPRPFVIYQQIGGAPIVTFCGEAAVNRLYQFVIWSSTRSEADSKMEAMSAILTAPPYRAVPQGGSLARYDEMTKTYGASRDFSFWT